MAGRLRGKIQAYEIINEACLFFSPEIYVELLKGASESIRREDPAAKIVGFCATEDYDVQWSGWLEQCLKLGGLQYADAVSFHPYGSKELNSSRAADKQIQSMFSLLKKYASGPLPDCWNTELYYLYDAAPGEFLDHIQPFHAATRFLVDLGEGLKQSVSLQASQLWKKILTPGSNVGVSWHELIPNETAVAYNALARYFEGAVPVDKFRLHNGNICYVYRRKTGGLIAALWNYEKQNNSRVDLGAFELLDIFGNPVKPGVATLGRDPVLYPPRKTGGDGVPERPEKPCSRSIRPLARFLPGQDHRRDRLRDVDQ